MARTPTEDLVPRLAESVPTFANGGLVLETDDDAPTGRLVATFRLRAGLTWHDGEPLSASDVVFAFEHDRAAPDGSAERAMADRMASVAALDARTVRVTYRAGERWERYPLAPRALPRHLLADAGPAQWARYEAAPVHAGPYRVASRTGGRIDLVAFERYWAGPPAIARITVVGYADRAAVLTALRLGEIDLAPSPDFDADIATTLERSVDQRSYSVRETPSLAVAMLRFGPRFSDARVRRAMAAAIDRERIARTFFAGRVRVVGSYLVAPLSGAIDIPPPSPDPARARALLSAAGFRPGSLGIAQRDGDRLILDLLVPEGSPSLRGTASGIGVDLAGIGIAVRVSERALAEVSSLVARGEFDLALMIERGDDALASTLNYRSLVSPWFDVLADAAREESDAARKRELYAELQREWARSFVAVPIYQAIAVDVVSTRVEGVQPAPFAAALTWNAGEWSAARR